MWFLKSIQSSFFSANITNQHFRFKAERIQDIQMQANNNLTGVDTSSSENSIQRVSTRYVRTDLKVNLIHYNLFSSSPLKTKLIDISSGGIKVSTSKKIRINKKLVISICFLDGYKFLIKGTIVGNHRKTYYLYDLCFESIDRYIHSQSAIFYRIYLYTSNFRLNTRYRNITSTRVQVLTDKKLTDDDNLTICFELNNGEKFERTANVIRSKKIIRNYYGIKFDRPNSSLGNYLLKTQKSLAFA